VGDHLLDELVFSDRFAEGPALQGILDRLVDAGADNAHRSGCDAEASVVQAAHRNLKAFPLLTQPVTGRHAHVLHVDPAGIAGPDAHFAFKRAGGEALPAALQDERGDAARALVRLRFGENEEPVGHVRQRNPHLLAGEDVFLSLANGTALERRNIRPRARLGQAKTGDLVAAGKAGQKGLLLLFRSPLEYRQGVQREMDRDRLAHG